VRHFPIAVMASGTGSNFENLVERSRAGSLPVDVRLLITDVPMCGAHQKAQRFGIPVAVVPREEFPRKTLMEEEIRRALASSDVELVVLAGYMRLVGRELVSEWRGRMINLHPSLLPAFPGLDAVGQALEAGVKVTGVTVHVVDEGLDTGPIVAQRAFEVPEGASREEVEATLHAVEHELLPCVVGLFAEGRVQVEGRKVRILQLEAGVMG
jgi:phosphoribosylglycinamide formyltransferase 1